MVLLSELTSLAFSFSSCRTDKLSHSHSLVPCSITCPPWLQTFTLMRSLPEFPEAAHTTHVVSPVFGPAVILSQLSGEA